MQESHNKNVRAIYIDVTQSYRWKGEVTGIIRVMDEISKRYITNSSATFVIWDEQSESFFAVDFDKVLNDREKTKLKALQKSESDSDVDRSRLRKIKKVFFKIPLTAKTYLFFKEAVSKQKHRRAHHESVNFQKGSTLFMPHGGVWESKAYIAQVLELKNTREVKLAPIVYDFCPVLTPQFCAEGVRKTFSYSMKRILPQSAKIISISENTAKDAKSWLKSQRLAVPEIEIIRLGDEVDENLKKPAQEKIPNQYVLCVGTVEARKNHTLLYYAYKLASQNGIELPSVLIVGRIGWLANDIHKIISLDPDTKDKFIFLQGVKDHELSWLYKNALFSVYPSFYEGWGLPVAESLLYGTPCISSDTSSLPEVGRDLVEYCSPNSAESLLSLINKLYTDFSYRKERRDAINARYKTTSWDDTFAAVEKAIKSL